MKKATDVLNKPFHSNFLKLIFAGSLVGILTGLVVSLFRWIIDRTLSGLQIIYPAMAQHHWWILAYAGLTIIICLVLGYIIHPFQTDLVGSGVPQIEAILAGQHTMNWSQVLWRKFIGGLLAICPGLFLGREGPCIQMGAAIGQGFSEHFFHSNRDITRTLLSCGIAAGLSAAFSAPLAGTMFLLEEIVFHFQPQIWLTALAAAICSDVVTVCFFGTKPCLFLPITSNLPVHSYPIMIILGIILGVCAYGYQYCLLNLRWWFSKIRQIPAQYHSIFPLLLIIPVGLWQPKILGGSHVLINYLVAKVTNVGIHHYSQLIMYLLIFLVIRFVWSMLSYGATVPGGIFMPILVLGALLGCISAPIMIQTNVIPATDYINIIAFSMAAYFGAIEHAPFTAILLITEMVGSIEHILPMTIMTFVAYIINDLLGGRPIYTALREELFA